MAPRRGRPASACSPLRSPRSASSPGQPDRDARPTGRLDGTKVMVRAGTVADLFLVTATGSDGAGVFLVESGGVRAATVEQRLSDGDRRRPARAVRRRPAERLRRRVARRGGSSSCSPSAAAAEQLGVTEGALQLTASYAKTREQFGRPIGTFQAVSQRLADGYIDVLAPRLTLWQAVWRLAEGLPADVEVATAKLWAADAGHRLAHTTVHVHGGVGIDLDGEAHRYFTAPSGSSSPLGGATEQARAVGRLSPPSRPSPRHPRVLRRRAPRRGSRPSATARRPGT